MAAGLCNILSQYYDITFIVNEQCFEFYKDENFSFKVTTEGKPDIDLDNAYEEQSITILQAKPKQQIFIDKIEQELSFLHSTNETVKPEIKWINTYLRL